MAVQMSSCTDPAMFQAAKTKLDRTFDLLKSELQANGDQQDCLLKATQTLEKASQILRRLVRKIWDEDDCKNGPSRSSKKRHENQHLFASTMNEPDESRRDQTSAEHSVPNVRTNQANNLEQPALTFVIPRSRRSWRPNRSWKRGNLRSCSNPLVS